MVRYLPRRPDAAPLIELYPRGYPYEHSLPVIEPTVLMFLLVCREMQHRLVARLRVYDRFANKIQQPRRAKIVP